MLPRKLDYLFVAEFKDGSRYFQDRYDRSIEHPLSKSAFYDVSQHLADVSTFTLTDGNRKHTVFLSDGHFQTDGTIITSPYGELTNYRLIYFRRVQQVTSRDGVSSDIVGYFIGWQANDASGKNYQMMLEIPPTGKGKSRIGNKG